MTTGQLDLVNLEFIIDILIYFLDIFHTIYQTGTSACYYHIIIFVLIVSLRLHVLHFFHRLQLLYVFFYFLPNCYEYNCGNVIIIHDSCIHGVHDVFICRSLPHKNKLRFIKYSSIQGCDWLLIREKESCDATTFI